MNLLVALRAATGLYLTKDGDGSLEQASVYHEAPENGLQTIVFEGLQKSGYALLKVEPAIDEQGYLSVAFIEKEAVFYRIEADELVLSTDNGVLLEERSKKFLEKGWGQLPVSFKKAKWKPRGFMSETDKAAFTKDTGEKS